VKRFKPSTAAEIQFMRQLRKVGRVAGHIVQLHLNPQGFIVNMVVMQAALKAYSLAVEPWAKNQARKMLATIENSNKRAMRENAKAVGHGMRLIAESAVGAAAAKLMDEQVELIKSIPIRAGERAQKLAMEAVISGERASEVAKRLAKSGKVAESDANLIARTEVARANSVLTQSRATAIGSTHYIWRTSKDSAVRHSHAEMEGKVERWDEPPTLSDGMTGNPGTFPNCRCYPEPLFTDLF
jgi:SPP1 gp7 family putative phage head morphogenesis protein